MRTAKRNITVICTRERVKNALLFLYREKIEETAERKRKLLM